MKIVKVFEVGGGAAEVTDQTVSGKGRALENRIRKWLDEQPGNVDILQLGLATDRDGSVYAALLIETK